MSKETSPDPTAPAPDAVYHRLAKMEGEVQERRTEVDILKAQVDRLRARRERQQHQVTQQAKTIRRLQKKLGHLEERLESLDRLLDAYHEQMSPDAYVDLRRQVLKGLEGEC